MEENTGRKKSGFAAGLLTGIVIMAVISILGFGGWYIVNRNSSGSYTSENVTEGDVSKKLDQLNQLIDKYYLYQDEVDQDALVEGIYSGYAAALGDPYTVYYNKDETKALMESTSGTFSGVGATLTRDADTKAVTIVNVYQDSPAEKAGLKAGDILEKVDDHEVGDEELDTIVSWIKGEKGTEVTLYVLRDGKEETLTATRDTIEFKAALDDLENQGMEGLVIDLRNNPGGNLDVVCNMLKLLLPEGTIVSTKDKNGKTDKITCDGTNEFKKPLAVLVNQYSASASEICSGAIQDYGTGKIVGVTTYGKGVVQQLLDLGDGTCFKVTIAEYYTPSGKSINKKGVEPDIEVEYQYDEADPKKDNQLDKALETVSEELK